MFYRFVVIAYQSSLIFSSCYKQAILERMHITSSGIEDFASSRRHIDNLSMWTMFQLLHSTLLESDRAARGRSLFEKKSYRLEEQSFGFRERVSRKNQLNLPDRLEDSVYV